MRNEFDAAVLFSNRAVEEAVREAYDFDNSKIGVLAFAAFPYKQIVLKMRGKMITLFWGAACRAPCHRMGTCRAWPTDCRDWTSV